MPIIILPKLPYRVLRLVGLESRKEIVIVIEKRNIFVLYFVVIVVLAYLLACVVWLSRIMLLVLVA